MRRIRSRKSKAYSPSGCSIAIVIVIIVQHGSRTGSARLAGMRAEKERMAPGEARLLGGAPTRFRCIDRHTGDGRSCGMAVVRDARDCMEGRRNVKEEEARCILVAGVGGMEAACPTVHTGRVPEIVADVEAM